MKLDKALPKDLRILQAAEKIFSMYGYEKATLDEIIALADVGKGTVRVKYPAYTVWKLSLVQRIGNAFKVTAALDNLFGYKPKYYYLNSPITDGATFQIGMSIDIDKLF